MKKYFIEVVVPFAVRNQSQTTEKEQLPEMATVDENEGILTSFLMSWLPLSEKGVQMM